MTFLTLKQQEILEKEMEKIQTIMEEPDFTERIDCALKTFYGYYRPTCRTEEDMHANRSKEARNRILD